MLDEDGKTVANIYRPNPFEKKLSWGKAIDARKLSVREVIEINENLKPLESKLQ